MYAITSTAKTEALTETEASVWFLLQTETAAVLLVCVQPLFPTSPWVSPNQPENKSLKNWDLEWKQIVGADITVNRDCFYSDLQQTARDKSIIISHPLVNDGQTNPVQLPVRHYSPRTCICAQWQTEWHAGIKVRREAATGLVMSCVVRYSVH